MKVLMVEHDTEPAHRMAEQLVATGHSVHSCHDGGVGIDAGTCVALQGRPCPLSLTPMDLFLDVMAPTQDGFGVDLLMREEGVLCSKRRRIPIVIAGTAEGHPFRRFATMERSDLPSVADLEAVASAPLPDHSAVALTALRGALRAHGIEVGRAEAEVRRREGGLLLHIDVGDLANPAAAQAIAIKVGQAVRQLDPWAPSLDITLAKTAS